MASETRSIGDALTRASARVGRLDARVLMCHVLACKTSYLIAHDDESLDDALRQRFEALVDARQAGCPVAYLIGEREFYGRMFKVSDAVLIPRPETELIVDLAIEHYPLAPARVLDLGTGSGALAVTLACEWPAAIVVAVDASTSALDVARTNAHRLGARVEFIKSDWFSALDASSCFDLIVSNPPYIRSDDPHLGQGDVRFEPPGALVSGRDGLDDLRRIVSEATTRLTAGGWLFVEHGYDQAAAVRTLMAQAVFTQVQSWEDMAGIERITGGRLDAALRQA